MSTADRKLRVFLCHASQDKTIVHDLYQRLLVEGWIDPWLDEEKLNPGSYWPGKIEEAVEAADAVIVFLSNNSVTKEGVVQKEIRRALDKAEEKPEDVIFIIPLRLDECQVPRRLRSYQYQDYFDRLELAYKRLYASLEERARTLGIDIFEIKENLRKQDEERARKIWEEQIHREAEERIRREEEELIRKQAEERARDQALARKQAEEQRKIRKSNRYEIRLVSIFLVFICVLIVWFASRFYSSITTILLATDTPTPTDSMATPLPFLVSTDTPSFSLTEPNKTQTQAPSTSQPTNPPPLISEGFDSENLDLSLWKFSSNSDGAGFSVNNGYLTVNGGSVDGGGGTIISHDNFMLDQTALRFEARVRTSVPGSGTPLAWWGIVGPPYVSALMGFDSTHNGITVLTANGIVTPDAKGYNYYRLDGNTTEWHNYIIEIYPDRTLFYVDGAVAYSVEQIFPTSFALRVVFDCGSGDTDQWMEIDYMTLGRITMEK